MPRFVQIIFGIIGLGLIALGMVSLYGMVVAFGDAWLGLSKVVLLLMVAPGAFAGLTGTFRLVFAREPEDVAKNPVLRVAMGVGRDRAGLRAVGAF